MDTTALIECVHGYPEGCPDCDVASYLPSVLDGVDGASVCPEAAGRTEIVDGDGWMDAPNLAPENFQGGG